MGAEPHGSRTGWIKCKCGAFVWHLWVICGSYVGRLCGISGLALNAGGDGSMYYLVEVGVI
ncbi:MAG: hypothetical protein OXH65_03080 [Paracoccaceae bacterium]|nr:hypothetical protein [Paracoccaceae bacterium]